jgi:hypothetical protein
MKITMISLQTVETKECIVLQLNVLCFLAPRLFPCKCNASLFIQSVFTIRACYMRWELNGKLIFKYFTGRSVLQFIVLV